MSGSDAAESRWVGPGLLLVLATAIVSGVSTFLNAYAVRGTTSDAFVTVRNLAVVAMLLPLAVLGERARRGALRRADWGRLLAIGVLGGGIPFLLFFHGLALASAAHGAPTASFLYRTLFLMATVLGVVALGERWRARALAGAALVLVGNLLLLSLTGPVWSDGSLYVLAATGLWAVEYTISKSALRDLPSATVGFARMGIGAAFLVGYVAVVGEASDLGTLSPAEWPWLLLSAVLLAAFVATWYAGLRRVELGAATSVLVLGFPITWALSIAFQGTTPTPATLAGAAAVAVGVAAIVGIGLGRATWRYLRASVGAPARS